MANVIEMVNVIETAKTANIAFSAKDWDKLKELFAENGVYDEKGTGRRLQGVGPVLEAWQGWAKAFPDLKATVLGEHASGDTAILEVVWKATQTRPLLTSSDTIPPSHKRVEVPACQVMKFEGGQVQTYAHYFDRLTLLAQIGAVKG